MHLKCSAKWCITNMLRGPLLGIYMLSWNIRVLKAYILILFPSSWNLILVPVESLDSDDVCARYWPQSFFFFFVRLISHLPLPIIATFPLSESSSAHPSLWVWAKCLKAMGSVHWGLRPLGFRSGALLLSFYFCFWTCNSPIICKGLKARESFFSLQRCRVITLRCMCWYQLGLDSWLSAVELTQNILLILNISSHLRKGHINTSHPKTRKQHKKMIWLFSSLWWICFIIMKATSTSVSWCERPLEIVEVSYSCKRTCAILGKRKAPILWNAHCPQHCWKYKILGDPSTLHKYL